MTINKQIHDSPIGEIDPSPALRSQLATARLAFHRYRSQCFWSLRQDLEIREEHLPMIAKGLRLHGGREGRQIAEKLGF